MPGHNAIEQLNNDGNKTLAGKILQVGSFGNITNSAGAMPSGVSGVDYQGYSPGALLLNANATTNKTTTTLYVNLGTTTTAVWTALTVS